VVRVGRLHTWVPFFLTALGGLLQLDLDVGSCHANAVSHNGSLRRRTHNLARPNVECGQRSVTDTRRYDTVRPKGSTIGDWGGCDTI
jgi:hypothetical protein